MKKTQDQKIIKLIDDFCQGNNDAFATLFITWKSELFLYTHKFLKNREDTEDVLYDCVEKLLNSDIDYRLEKFIQEGIQLKPYLKLVLKNRALDFIKVKKNRKRIIESLYDFFVKESFNESNVKETESFLKYILKDFSHRDKEILKMHMQGYNLEDIGSKYFLSKKTISNIVTRCRNELRIKFKNNL